MDQQHHVEARQQPGYPGKVQASAGGHEARHGDHGEAAQRHRGRVARFQNTERPEDQSQNAQGKQAHDGNDPFRAAFEFGEDSIDVRRHELSAVPRPWSRAVSCRAG
jgi:hypothetical protein